MKISQIGSGVSVANKRDRDRQNWRGRSIRNSNAMQDISILHKETQELCKIQIPYVLAVKLLMLDKIYLT